MKIRPSWGLPLGFTRTKKIWYYWCMQRCIYCIAIIYLVCVKHVFRPFPKYTYTFQVAELKEQLNLKNDEIENLKEQLSEEKSKGFFAKIFGRK